MLPLPTRRVGQCSAPGESGESTVWDDDASSLSSTSTSQSHTPQSDCPEHPTYQPGTPRPRRTQVIRARWSSERATLSDVGNWDLPCLVRIKSGGRHARRSRESDTSLLLQGQYLSTSSVGGQSETAPGARDTPLLVYAMQKCSKVQGSMLQREPDSDKVTESGPQLVLPVNYPGWFQFVRDDDTVVFSLGTIAEVARAEYREFISHTPLVGYRYAKRSEDGNRLYAKYTVKAGEVLTTKNVLTEWLSTESVSAKAGCGACFRRRKPKQEPSFLKCRDATGRRLILPFTTAGQFSEVGQRGAEVKDGASYQLTDIARWVQLPVTLKHVCGDTPAELEFSGLVRLDEVYFEHSVVACTTGVRKEHGNQLLEFPVDTDVTLTRCRNWTELVNTEAVESALLHCEDNFNNFVTEIKVASDSEYKANQTENDTTVSQVRALPPTPLLPTVAKAKRSRAWMWAKHFLSSKRVSKQNPNNNDSASEDSDYEVIPFYLRTVDSGTSLDDTDKDEDTAVERHERLAHDDGSCDCHDASDCPSARLSPPTRPVPPTPIIRNIGGEEKQDKDAHDEAGYLLPVEFRESIKNKTVDVSTRVDNVENQTALSSSFHSSVQDTCSSTTVTRGTDGTTCTLNKSTETILAPATAATAPPSDSNRTQTSEYCPSNKFDKQRLDSFLADSIHELQRRQSRENILVRNPSALGKVPRDKLPPLDKKDMTNFLDKLFDCDQNEDRELCSQSSGITSDLPLTGARSMSVPEAMLARTLDPRMLRAGIEWGYQTLDSGIWLSPRSAVSDPYRHERDSATYRSTSDCSWVPPEQVAPLTVEEVGLSLQYIGMKDHIVTRFCEEQIDGKQLTELTDQLLVEGFPELNALDRKKLTDFIKGWRPKKWGLGPVE